MLPELARRCSRATRPALVAALVTVVGASSPDELEIGRALPILSGETLDRRPLDLPGRSAGRPALVVSGFSKAAAAATRPWLERCRTEAADTPAPGLDCYDVRMLEDVPRLFRVMVERGMRKGYPPELRASVLLVYTQNDVWRRRLRIGDEDTAYVVIVDRDGYGRGLASGDVSPESFAKLVETVWNRSIE
jgi:hypothetical protein